VSRDDVIPILEYENTGKKEKRTRHLPSQLSSDSDQYKQKLKLSKSHPRAKSLTGKITKPFTGETQAQVCTQDYSYNYVPQTKSPQDKGDSQMSYHNNSPTYPNDPSMTKTKNKKSASCIAKPTSLALLSVQQPYNQKQIPNIASSIGNPVHSRSLSSAPR
jgi:hypothetical protein